jgi:RNA polymerase sigma-70 factor (ECF subfamily)
VKESLVAPVFIAVSIMTTTALHRDDGLLSTHQTLLERLKDRDDSHSWEVFFETYWRLIYGVAVKSGLSDAEAQEVVQETVIAVSKHIHKFNYDPKRGSFKNWLLNMTRWRILDQMRQRKQDQKFVRPASSTSEEGRTATIDRIPDDKAHQIQEVWEEQWRTNLMEAAIERVKDSVPARRFQIFYFYVIKQLPVLKVSQMFDVNIGHVYLIKHRVSFLIRKEMKRLESKMK